jgi:hypothetical protein
MPKLHEVLAVESGLQTTAKRTNEETVRTFGKKDEHFIETVKTITHFAEDDRKLDTTETSAMVTTVFDKLLYNAGPNVRALDAFLQREATNQKAVADIVVGERVLAENVPGAVLLGMETKLAELREVYLAIPTLAPGPVWELDADARTGGGVYRARDPDVTFRTKRLVKPIVMAEATKEHPAQVQAIQEDAPIARIATTRRSGMITTAQKSALLERVDRLLRAVKRARQRANNTEVEKRQIGKVLFEYLHDGIVA